MSNPDRHFTQQVREFHHHRLVPVVGNRWMVQSPRGHSWVTDSLEMAQASVLEESNYGFGGVD